jgi:hypothetical protein
VATSVGTRKAIYALTRRGAAVAGVQFRRVRFLKGRLIGSDLFIEHQLQLNSIYLSLTGPPTGVEMNNWNTFDDPLSPAINLKPDAYCELRSDAVRPIFVEVDTGTETRRIWRRKTNEYLKLAVTEDFQRLFHQKQFRVLIITTSERRLQAILRPWPSRLTKSSSEPLSTPLTVNPFGTTSGSVQESPRRFHFCEQSCVIATTATELHVGSRSSAVSAAGRTTRNSALECIPTRAADNFAVSAVLRNFPLRNR